MPGGPGRRGRAQDDTAVAKFGLVFLKGLFPGEKLDGDSDV